MWFREIITKGKDKAIPIQAMEALRVARGWGFHIFRHSAHRWRQGCQTYAPAAFYPQEDSWYSCVLEAESTPGAILRLEGLGKLKKSTSSGTRTGDLPSCSIVPQPITLPRAPIVNKVLINPIIRRRISDFRRAYRPTRESSKELPDSAMWRHVCKWNAFVAA
jgi:hypothetical protein